jgi:cytosol alanyl aminopeptidase
VSQQIAISKPVQTVAVRRYSGQMRILLVALMVAGCSPPPQTAAIAPTTPTTPPGSVTSGTGPGPHGLVPPEPQLRLPRNFSPTRYAATLAIDPARDGFDGTIAITGAISEASSVVWLHSHRLTIARAAATRGADTIALTATPRGDDLLELRAATPLAPGTWTLALGFAGTYDQVNTSGVFKQTVRGASYVYTQFEALYARRAFPCFDEPDSKVAWQLTLDVPAQLVAVSNTPVARETALGADRKRIEFAPTKPLPSYLVAFGVGPFDLVDAGKTRSGTPVRVVTMRDRAPEAAWAARTAAPIVDLLEALFGSRYPYEKLDLLTIPVTVGFGAMENAGLITFTETVMLIDPARPAKQREYTWIQIAAHELAHQWFGNLVTMAWWDDIWLNEGFANWIQRKVAARFEPAWNEALSEVDARNTALGADALVSARQIREPIVAPDDILNAFDGITYNKGASVLNMFEGYVGPERFMRGVADYLARHAFGNATSRDFAAAISQAAGKDVAAAFASFLDQPGAPELTATLECTRGAPVRLALSQRRYVPPGAPAPPAGKPWIVPVCAVFDRAGQRAEACTLLDAATGSLALDTPSCPRWVMANVDGRGYYRIAYTAPQVTALRDAAWPQLRPSERRAVAFDVTEAAHTGRLPLALGLSFVPRLLAAGDRSSIGAALALPIGVRDDVPDELRPAYEAWLRRTFGPAARKAGLLPTARDSLDVEVARTQLINAGADLGRDPELTAQAVQLAAGWRDLPPAVRGAVVTVAAHASSTVFDRLRAEIYTEPDRERRAEIAYALASTLDVHQQRDALALLLDPKLDVRDVQFMLLGASSEANRVVAQQFFAANQEAILRRLPSESATGGATWLAYVFTSSCSAQRRDELVDYVTSTFRKLAGGPRVVAQAIEAMDHCIARRAALEPELRRWLDARRLAGPAAPATRAAR